MALYQRISPASSRGAATEASPKRSASQASLTKYRLLMANEVPSWYAHNPYLLTSYRPVSGSVETCIRSLRHVHNETVNVYTHLVPGLAAGLGNLFLYQYFQYRYATAPLVDRLAVHVFLTSSVICFSISSIYHTLNCHSEAYHALWARWDYAAIITQTIGSFVSGIYVTFYCNPGLQKTYWTMTGILGGLSIFVVVNPRYQSKEWRSFRIATFVGMGLSGLLPISHASLVYPWALLSQKAGLGYYLVEGLALITGTAFYATHFPESWMPKRFDVLGASHQIFHVFVVLAAFIHLWGLLSVYDWIYRNAECLT